MMTEPALHDHAGSNTNPAAAPALAAEPNIYPVQSVPYGIPPAPQQQQQQPPSHPDQQRQQFLSGQIGDASSAVGKPGAHQQPGIPYSGWYQERSGVPPTLGHAPVSQPPALVPPAAPQYGGIPHLPKPGYGQQQGLATPGGAPMYTQGPPGNYGEQPKQPPPLYHQHSAPMLQQQQSQSQLQMPHQTGGYPPSGMGFQQQQQQQPPPPPPPSVSQSQIHPPTPYPNIEDPFNQQQNQYAAPHSRTRRASRPMIPMASWSGPPEPSPIAPPHVPLPRQQSFNAGPQQQGMLADMNRMHQSMPQLYAGQGQNWGGYGVDGGGLGRGAQFGAATGQYQLGIDNGEGLDGHGRVDSLHSTTEKPTLMDVANKVLDGLESVGSKLASAVGSAAVKYGILADNSVGNSHGSGMGGLTGAGYGDRVNAPYHRHSISTTTPLHRSPYHGPSFGGGVGNVGPRPARTPSYRALDPTSLV